MESCRGAKRILIGAMINIGAIADLIDDKEPVLVVCSGTDGEITGEDVMFAGALMDRLEKRVVAHPEFDSAKNVIDGIPQIGDRARIAINHWQSTCRMMDEGKPLADFFRTARGGINLVKIGHDDDIVFASQIDTVPLVPELKVEEWKITRMDS